MAHGQELKGICKTTDNSKGLGYTAICHLLFVWEGKDRKGEKEEARKAGRQQEGRQMLL